MANVSLSKDTLSPSRRPPSARDPIFRFPQSTRACSVDGSAPFICGEVVASDVEVAQVMRHDTCFFRARRFGFMSSLVRLLGFTKLTCGCVIGRYREVATSREVAYVEEKGAACTDHSHRRNHTVGTARFGARLPVAITAKAS
jgi:hypothetical protein